jgi:hypothetical protein
MKKQLDIAIVDAIKSIIQVADCDVEYDIKKNIESPNWVERNTSGSVKREVVSVSIKLTKVIP